MTNEKHSKFFIFLKISIYSFATLQNKVYKKFKNIYFSFCNFSGFSAVYYSTKFLIRKIASIIITDIIFVFFVFFKYEVSFIHK